jgi:hypothetical protein
VIVPCSSTLAVTSATMAAPNGPHDNSSARLQSTRTCVPGIRVASNAASIATSSAALWP